MADREDAPDGEDTREHATRTPDEASGDGTRDPSAPFVFLFGMALVAVGGVAFLADLGTGHDVARSVLLTAAGAVVLVAWAAYDTLSNPDSAVDTPVGASATALLLFGVYLLVAAVVVGATSPWHGRLGYAFLLGSGAIGAALVGIVVFLVASFVTDREPGAERP